MNKWISVKERLPEKKVPVLVCVAHPEDTDPRPSYALFWREPWNPNPTESEWSWYAMVTGEWFEEMYEDGEFITHWMPLPLPPGEEK